MYYLQVSDSEYERAAKTRSASVVTQLLPQLGKTNQNSEEKSNAEDSQVPAEKRVTKKAGERIRTADVQLGKLAFYH